MQFSKLENVEAIGLISIIMLNKIILNFPKSIIAKTGTAGWINVIYLTILTILLSIFITKLLKKFPASDILDISNYLGKKPLKTLTGILHIIFLISIISFVLRNFTENLKIIYFNQSPLIFILLFFLIVAAISCKFGIKTIAKTTLIITPLILFSILFILFSSTQSFVPQRLFPLFGYGLDQTFLKGATNIFGYSGIVYLYFLKPLLKNEQKFEKISIISIILSGMYLLLSIICLLASFSFILETDESISIFILSKMAKYGNFIRRANAIFIFICILSVLSYLCITLYFIIYITKKIINIKNTSTINYSYCSIIFGTTLIFENFAQYLNVFDTIIRYTILILIFGFDILLLILANIKYKLKEKL